MKEKLTELEKIILSWAVVQSVPVPWPELYRISHARPAGSHLNAATVSRWKNSAFVVNYYNEQKQIFNLRIKELAKGLNETNETGETGRETKNDKNNSEFAGGVDFTNRDEVIKYLNRVINTTKDERQRFDALKMLSDLQQFKQTDGKQTELQRFYTPLSCKECKLYQDKQNGSGGGV